MKKDRKSPKITALLTGRGGSSLKDKNVLPVAGKPLLYYPAQAALNSDHIEEYYVSSDDKKILDAAEKLGYEPIERPAEIASATAQHEDVIMHGLEVIKERSEEPDILIVLLANTVVVKTEWINTCIEELLKDETLTSVSPVYDDSDHHPYRAKRINNDGLLEPFFDFSGKHISTNRQDLDPSYFFCHNFWALRTRGLAESTGQQPWKFMGDRIKPHIISGGYIDVHDEEDLAKSEEWLKQNK